MDFVVQLQLPAADISRIRIDYLRYKPGTAASTTSAVTSD